MSQHLLNYINGRWQRSEASGYTRVTNPATAEVIDDGRGGTPEAGSGLRGLEERVRERGGTLIAEPLPHEGFRLRVTLPLRDVLAPLDTVSA